MHSIIYKKKFHVEYPIFTNQCQKYYCSTIMAICRIMQKNYKNTSNRISEKSPSECKDTKNIILNATIGSPLINAKVIKPMHSIIYKKKKFMWNIQYLQINAKNIIVAQ